MINPRFYLTAILVAATTAWAAQQTFVREYVYQANDYDSRLTCRAIALEQVKRSLLEELGTYLESRSEYNQGSLVHDDIMVMTAGVAQVQVLGESWDGTNYWIKTQLTADPDSVMAALRGVLTDRGRARELMELKARTDGALQEIDRLRRELATARSDNLMFARQISYLRQTQVLSASQWTYRGTAYLLAGDNGLALAAFSTALENDTANAVAYANRGVLYARAGDYLAAFRDYSRALRLDPGNAGALYNRGIADYQLADYDAAIRDYSEALALSPKNQKAFFNRALAFQQKKQFQKAALDFGQSLALDSADAAAYNGRGASLAELKQYKRAIADYSKAIALDPKRSEAYANRAEAQFLSGDYQQALYDAQMAAELGDTDVRALLEKLELLNKPHHEQ